MRVVIVCVRVCVRRGGVSEPLGGEHVSHHLLLQNNGETIRELLGKLQESGIIQLAQILQPLTQTHMKISRACCEWLLVLLRWGAEAACERARLLVTPFASALHDLTRSSSLNSGPAKTPRTTS